MLSSVSIVFTSILNKKSFTLFDFILLSCTLFDFLLIFKNLSTHFIYRKIIYKSLSLQFSPAQIFSFLKIVIEKEFKHRSASK